MAEQQRENDARLVDALDSFSHTRQYAARAHSDASQAVAKVGEARDDLLAAIAQRLLATPNTPTTRQDLPTTGQQIQNVPIVPCSRCGVRDVLNRRPDSDLALCERCAVNTALTLAAENIERELICCDVYERLTAKGHENWTEEDVREKDGHAICYWSSASRSLVLDLLSPSSSKGTSHD